MVFVADALGAWLVEQLADAGRKKLTELMLGSEQERALRRAADVAVWATAMEMSPSSGEQTEQVAMVISEVFRDPVPDAPLAVSVMLLEGLQAGIAGQLAVLDDAGLTGTGQSSADVLGVPGTVLADRLTRHLMREIIVRGSAGGPLTPLADQFNHELTRLQIGGMFARLAGEIRNQTIDYRLDVARLATATENALRSLEVTLTTIPAPGQPIALQRPAVDALVGRAHGESFLVVGDPGAGKTVALHDLARRAAADHVPVLFLSVGSTAAASEGGLRNELGLEHNLIDVLQHWSPGGGGLFVIDALDAARNDPQADLWRSIIDIARDRLPEWRVVASVRTWDLQHSPRLKAQFPGQAVHLDELDEGELAQAAAAWPDLGALLRAARPDLHHLLRNPFNLRLAAELLLSGATTRELQQVNDQLELLHRYWEYRVSDRPGGLARGALLARVCNYAVRHRTLTAPVGEVLAGDVTEGEVLETLLSRSVLTEALELPSGPATGSVRFAHHVLFDYAVAVTVFAVAEETLRARLHDDPDLVLFARPSIDMHLERLWTADPRRFFEVSLAMAEDSALPRLATLVTAEVAARRAERLGDLGALLGPVMDGGASPGALRVLRYLAVAVVIDREDAEDASPGIWPTVVERLSENVTVTELPLRIMLDSLVGRGGREGTVGRLDLARCGLAARRLLEYLWTMPPTPVIRVAIEAVIATAESDPTATETLLGPAVNTGQMTARGYNDLFWLTDGVPRLAAVVPGLVEQIYTAVMAYRETSTQPTQLGSGLILSLTSSRRQDIDGARSHLVQHYRAYLEASPHSAVTALAQLIIDQHRVGPRFTAGLLGSPATIAEDGSGAWDERDLADGHNIISLLNAFEDYIADHADHPLITAVFDALTTGPRPAALWRRILAAGVRNRLVADRLFPLDQTLTQCLTKDLEEPLAQLIAARKAERPVRERGRLDAAVAALAPGGEDDGSLEWARTDHRYRRFLDALQPAGTISPGMAADRATPGRPSLPGEKARRGPHAESAERYGIVLHTDADRSIWPLIDQVKQFTETHLNDVPASDEIEPNLRAIKRLRDALNSQNASLGLREFAESTLARAAEVLTRRADLHPEELSFARTVLLDLRSHRLPTPAQEGESDGTKAIPPGPGGDVARGLLQLARMPGYYDHETRTAIETLAEDAVPWARYSVARGLPLLRDADPETMWDLLRHIAQRDSSDRVLAGVVRAVWALRGDAEAAVDVVRHVAVRVTPTGQRDSAFEACTEAAGLLWVLDGLPAGHAILKRLIDLQAYGPDALTALLGEIRNARALTHDNDAIRGRALHLCQQLTDLGFAAAGDLSAIGVRSTKDEQAQIGAGIELLGAVVAALYYASGAFDARRGGTEAAAPAPAQIRLVDESRRMIVQLGRAPIPSITHNLVEVLAHVLDQRPELALLTTRDIVVSGGQAGHYQLDILAVDTMVRIVERALAGHRGILRAPRNLTALRELLEVFVEAGWPTAHRLAFGLEHIFR